MAAEARVMKIHFANLNFFSLSRWTTDLNEHGTNKLVEPGMMHRRRPIKNALPLLLVLNQWDTISRFHYEWCATNLICASRDKKKVQSWCTATEHFLHIRSPFKTHPIDDTMSSKEFRLRIRFKNANESVTHKVLKCLTFSLILNSILQFSASKVFENMLPACDTTVNGDENRKLNDEETRARVHKETLFHWRRRRQIEQKCSCQ